MTEYLSEGQILEGKYRILRHIGEGGMGVVYEAEHTDLHLRVAIKILHPTEAFDPNMIARFKTEARSAAGIRHRNVVEVTDFGLTPDQRPFFVMEYLNGESLADRMDRRGSMSERETVEIADQILSGLSIAHKKGIIHRDLKPENVLFARSDDGRETVKLLDFGIAKIVGGTTSHHNNDFDENRPKTQRGVVLGTPGYMAPETVTGRTDADQRSDLFAVGVLLYEMLVGRRPFTGQTPHEIMMATATKPVPRPTAVRPGVSEAMERLVLTALAKDPNDRFQNTDEMVRQLTAAAVGRIPADARQCKTKVGLPSIAPDSGYVDRGKPTEEIQQKHSAHASRPISPGPRGAPVAAMKPYKGSPRNRRVVLPISPWFIVFLLIVGAAVYYFFFFDSPFRVIEHDEANKIHEMKSSLGKSRFSAGDGNDGASAAASDDGSGALVFTDRKTERVTIWLDIRPKKAAVTWDGKAMPGRPLLVPMADKPVKMRLDAEGFAPKTLSVTPDKEKTIRVRLKRLKK